MADALWTFGLLLFALVPAVVVARRVGPVLVARYDGAALRVAPPEGAAQPAARTPLATRPADGSALQAWCFAGAGDGRSPFWRPWTVPRVEQRFSIATWAEAAGAELPRLVEAFARHIDGSDRLDALAGPFARIALRLRVKGHDAMWWRARQSADPWDSGYLVDDAEALQALRRFLPRRATLLVAQDLPLDALRERITLLGARRAAFHHPVRLLVLGTVLPPGWTDLTVQVLPR
jgi:hypothetical protein